MLVHREDRELWRVGRLRRWTLSRVVWRKSSRSGANGCVEVAFLDTHVALRDSKDQHLPNWQRPTLVFSSAEWEQFIFGVCDGQFDLSSFPQDHA
jgi:Domain of unknown function (DUF397)